MTEDLLAIELLARRYREGFATLPRYSSGEAIVLSPKSPVLAEGLMILGLIERELAKSPDDFDAKFALSVQLECLGQLHYQALLPTELLNKKYADLHKDAVWNAWSSCNYMMKCHENMPLITSMMIMADIFRLAHFYGTSVYWLNQTINLATNMGDQEAVTEARAARMKLEMNGKTADPAPNSSLLFPLPNTPGLVVGSGQPSPSQAAFVHESTKVNQPPFASPKEQNPPETVSVSPKNTTATSLAQIDPMSPEGLVVTLAEWGLPGASPEQAVAIKSAIDSDKIMEAVAIVRQVRTFTGMRALRNALDLTNDISRRFGGKQMNPQTGCLNVIFFVVTGTALLVHTMYR